jgi:septal ring factor EnvC (AmiA/AmiB activator)
MKPELFSQSPEQISRIQQDISAVRKELTLAKQKRVGLQAAIDSREKYLARLEAQLVLSGPVQLADAMRAG